MAVLAAGVVSLQILREHRAEASVPAANILYVRSPNVARRLVLSYKSLAADIYWIRVVQYYGSTRLSTTQTRSYDMLFPLLQLTTALDPQFSIAYRFGAFFLSEQPPGGPGRPELATQLLDSAIAANPDRWEYPYDVGFLYYRGGDYQSAVEWFKRAAAVKNAPVWLEPMVAVTLAAGGQTTASRALWQQLLTSAEEGWLRNVARHRLQQLDTIDYAKQMERAVAAYTHAHGQPPVDWVTLQRAGVIGGLPVDAAGYPLVLKPDTGVVTVSSQSPMWPLPTEKAP